MKTPVQIFEPNLVGRDFVIGDLHGAFELFNKLLKNIAFDPTKDRMFSVTDLVDRGPDSLECLCLLKKPWFHGVLANHEQMMLEAFDGGYMGQFWIRNGGLWGYTAYQEWQNRTNFITDELKRPPPPSSESIRLWDMLDYVRELPYLITVKMKDGKKFHIIHAEFPPGNDITDEMLEDPVAVHRLAKVQSREGDFFCWGRYLFARFFDLDLPNVMEKVKRIVAYGGGAAPLYGNPNSLFNDKLSHIISGHTIMHHPLTILGQTNIDTCAYGALSSDPKRWEALTCVELGSWSFYQQRKDDFRTVDPLVVNMADVLEIQNGKAT